MPDAALFCSRQSCRIQGAGDEPVQVSFRHGGRGTSGEPQTNLSAVTCETIRDEASLASLAGSWDGLVRSMSRPSPFMLHGWLLEWWRAFGRGSDLAVPIACRDGRLVGALPLFVRSRWGVRVGAFLGHSESALADLLVSNGLAATVGPRLVEQIAASRIDAVDLFGLPGESRLAAAVGPSGLQVIQRVEAPVIEVGRDWDAFYDAKVHASRRRTIRRRAKTIGTLGKIALEHARTTEAIDAALGDAFRLHTLRWGSRPDHSTFGTLVGQRFHRAALRALAGDDVVRITTMKIDGRAIAFQLWFALGTSSYMYRQAYDPEFARFGLGFTITLDAMKAAVAEGLTRVELLGGAEPVKLEVADRVDPMYQGVGLARGIGGQVFVATRVGALRVTQRLRRSEQIRKLYYEKFGHARHAVLALRGPSA
jgi:CelD/BcsL family acetyltransferase involved in cellulose biosynthesis